MKHIKLDRVGERYITKQGCWLTITIYFGAHNCTVRFDNGMTVEGIEFSKIKKGEVRNPFHPSVYGVGYLGVGRYVASHNKITTDYYLRWNSMLERCCDENFKNKYETYKECSVSKKWECFQNFAEWHEENYNPKIMEGWALDKDILLKGNKIYSPETCCFVPSVINTLFLKSDAKRGKYPIGVKKMGNNFQARVLKNKKQFVIGTFKTSEEAFYAYKVAKELWIKEVADEWKPLIKPNVYQAMYNYKIEIDD